MPNCTRTRKSSSVTDTADDIDDGDDRTPRATFGTDSTPPSPELQDWVMLAMAIEARDTWECDQSSGQGRDLTAAEHTLSQTGGFLLLDAPSTPAGEGDSLASPTLLDLYLEACDVGPRTARPELGETLH